MLLRSGIGGIRRRRDGLLFCGQAIWVFLVHLNYWDLWIPFLSLEKEWYLRIFLNLGENHFTIVTVRFILVLLRFVMFLANLALPNSYVGFIDLVGTEK